MMNRRADQSSGNWREYGKQLEDLDRVSVGKLIEIAEKVGKSLSPEGDRHNNLKINQIRKFLDAARRIESEIKAKSFDEAKDAIVLLRPKLAYAAGRERRVKPLMDVLDPAIESGARSEANFNKLLRLIEAIIAYHRFYGGSN